MKAAIVGCGNMGKAYARHFVNISSVRVVGVCDTDPDKAREAAEIGGALPFASFEQMVSEVDPDVICVTLPTFLHKPFVLKAAEFGKHVICEKPLAPSLQDAREMVDACKRRGVGLFVGHVVRFFPNYADMKHKIASGVIGDVGIAHAKRMGEHPGHQRGWFADRDKSGGVILDLMIHDIDYMRWVLGDVETVFAKCYANGMMDYAQVTLRFKSGAIANLESFWGYPGSFMTAVEFFGQRGMMRFNSESSAPLHIQKRRPDNTVSSIWKSPLQQNAHYYEVVHFVECIQNGQVPIITADDAYKALEIAEAATQSAATGEPVHLNAEVKL